MQIGRRRINSEEDLVKTRLGLSILITILVVSVAVGQSDKSKVENEVRRSLINGQQRSLAATKRLTWEHSGTRHDLSFESQTANGAASTHTRSGSKLRSFRPETPPIIGKSRSSHGTRIR